MVALGGRRGNARTSQGAYHRPAVRVAIWVAVHCRTALFAEVNEIGA